MQPDRTHFAEQVLRHMAWRGIVALIIPVYSLILLRGLDPRIILLFGLPPLLAVLSTKACFSQATRRVAWTFLGAIALGALIARHVQLFPNLRGFDPNLPPWQDRVLMWYAGVYIIWLSCVLPVHIFLGSLRASGRGEPAPFSRFTCYLGLMTSGLFWVGMPGLLALLGFWPIL
jgi:hypothetical protein